MYAPLLRQSMKTKTKVLWLLSLWGASGLICPVFGAEPAPGSPVKKSKAAESGKSTEPRKRISNEEMAAMAGVGPDGTFGPSDDFGRVLNEALKREPVAKNGRRAADINVKYGDHERNTFDLWRSDARDPAPLVIFIHGGGFRRGDKALLYNSSVLADLLDAGFSVAGINYRFAKQSPEGSLGSMKDTARFVQFMRHHAKTYNIDPHKIACYGGSAGAVASLWLALTDDMAEPGSQDPIARESTRLNCVGAMATPATQDVLKWVDILGISREQAMGFSKALGGIESEADLFTEKNIRLRQQTDLITLMSRDDPPMFVHNSETGEVPTGYGHMAHHPNHARALKQRADEVGMEAVVYAPEIGLVDPSGDSLVSFFARHLLPKAAAVRSKP